MPEIHTLPLGAYQTNCYIVRDSSCSSCVIIDPGFEADTILNYVNQNGLTVDAVLLTHGHFDHVGAVETLVTETHCALWMAKEDWIPSKTPANAYLYPIAGCDFTDVKFCGDGQVICAGGLAFTVMATPGHTRGSVCYLCENALFSGDTLFAGSCGRTDLPGGSRSALRDSLSRLAALEGNYQVFPGHGVSSTLEHEKKNNPYLRG